MPDPTQIPAARPDQVQDPARLRTLRQATPARIGIGRAGARCTTEAMLRFRADQARANDAVYAEVSEDTVRSLGVFSVQTACRDKYEMITRPDHGRILPADQQEILRRRCVRNPQVQIYFGDGLCAPAIGANLPDLYPALRAELESEGVTVGTPFFVRYCRVHTIRTVGPLLGAEVTCVLIGERPGLVTSESMSAYIAYGAGPETTESDYTVVSNISRVGIPPVEAAAYVAELILTILREKRSGCRLPGAGLPGQQSGG